MKSSTRAIDRLITAIVGLLLLGGGGWLLAYRLGETHVVSATHRIDPHKIAGVPDYEWWPAAVGGIGVLLILLSLWLLLRHLHGSRATIVTTPTGGAVDLGKVADAVADELGRSELIERARATTVRHKGKSAIRVRATAAPDASITQLRDLTRLAQLEVKRASSQEVRLQMLVSGGRD